MITSLMGLTLIQASKKFKSNRLLRIFGRPNGISKNFVKYLNQLGKNKSSKCVRIKFSVYSGDKELQGSRHKRILGTTISILGYLVITRATGDEGMSDKDM